MTQIEPFILGKIKKAAQKSVSAVKNVAQKSASVVKNVAQTSASAVKNVAQKSVAAVAKTTTTTTIAETTITADPNSATETSTSTTIPETTIPETTIPETTIPETTIPVTTIPATTIPATTIPVTTIPATTTTIPIRTTTTIPATTTTIPATTTTIPATTTTKSNTNNISNYCYRDVNSNKIVCDNSVGLIDYTFKNPSSYVLNLSGSQVISNNKIITPMFQSQDEQTKYCTLVCSRNDACQGFKSTYDTGSNSYYCDFYKPSINIKNVLQPGQDSTSQKKQVQAACSRTSNYAYV
jgi:hypothetical protein